MNELAILAGVRLQEIRNRLRLLGRQSRLKIAVITFFSALFWLSLYKLFGYGLRYLDMVSSQFYFENLMEAMFDIFFFSLTMMLVFSNGIISYTSFFRSKETGFLMAAPVRPDSLFLYKLGESIAFSSWAFIFLATPLMAADGARAGAGPAYYVGTLLFFLAYVFVPAAIGAILAMAVTVWVPRTRWGIVMAGIGAAILVLLAIVGRLVSFRGQYAVDVRLVREVFDQIGFSRIPLLPSYWISRGIHLLRTGDLGGAAFFLGLIAANGAFLLAIAHRLSGSLLVRGWHVTQGLKSGRRYPMTGVIDAIFGALLVFVSPGVRHIVIKDVKSFVRDPVQWSQFLIFFGLLGIYFLNLRSFAYEERNAFWKNLIAQMNLLATSLTLATFSSRFIFPQLSLEGRRFWVIGMVPMDRDKIVIGKLALSFTCSLVISELLIGISSVMLQTPYQLAMLHGVTLLGICLGLSGLAVGLGAVYPNFGEDDPSKIVSGFGGTLNLVLSLTFVVAVMAVQAIPCFLYFGQARIGPGQFRTFVVAAMGIIGLISLAACMIPMSAGLKSIRRLEI